MADASYRFAATENDLTAMAARTARQKFDVGGGQPDIAPPKSILDRLTGMYRGFVNGPWTPGKPLPDIPTPGTPPRQFDYGLTYNIDIAPRSGMPIKFQELMGLADQWDLLRLIIERRKDQMGKLKWSITSTDEDADVSKDAGAQAIQEQLLSPDNEHDFATFQRAILEEVLVKDALAIEPVYYSDGTPQGFYGVAGETIQLKIDERGRTPESPNTAYQQVIKGVPWIDFFKPAGDHKNGELVYRPWNVRFSRMFGFSKVEQLYILANIGLRREMQQLYAFTDGNMPAALMEATDGWTPQQIAEFQAYFDSRYAGNLQQRSKMVVVPSGTKLHPFVADPLKNEFDEWMARLACFCFGVSPQGFIKEVNRATAYTASAAAASEGLEPLMSYIEGLWTFIIAKCYNRPDLRFEFNTSEDIDPGTANEISMNQIEHGVLSIDDFLESQGKDPIGVGYVFKTPAGPVSVEAWLANGGIPPSASPTASGGGDNGDTQPTASGSGASGPDLGKAAKAAWPKGHLGRLPMPNGTAQKKNSKRLY